MSDGAKAGEVTYLQAIRQALWDEMEADPSVLLVGQDVADFGGAFKLSAGLQDRFGSDRVINTPIAESGTLGMAVGSALLGERPVVEIQFSDFVTCGFNQIVNVAAKMYYRTLHSVPLVVRLPSGGGVGAGPFHSQSVEAWFLHAPGLKVVAPSSAEDAYGLLRAAIRDPNPVLFFEHKYLYRRIKGRLPPPDFPCEDLKLGKARIVKPGDQVTICGYGLMLHRALDAARGLEREGISIEVIDLRMLAPLDEDAIFESVRKTGKFAIVHEAPLSGGFGGEIAARVACVCFDYLDGPPLRIAFPDTPVPYHKKLEDESLPDVSRIRDELRTLALL